MEGGRIRIALVHGQLTHPVELDAMVLDDPLQAKSALMNVVQGLSKQIEAQHIKAARQGPRPEGKKESKRVA